MLKNSVEARSHRMLKKLPNYQEAASIQNLSHYVEMTSLEKEEVIIGIYERLTIDINELIVITNKGMFFTENGVMSSFQYEQIKYVETPKELGEEKLTIHLLENKTVILSVKGDKKFQHIFTFLRFLDRVFSDIQSGNKKESVNQ